MTDTIDKKLEDFSFQGENFLEEPQLPKDEMLLFLINSKTPKGVIISYGSFFDAGKDKKLLTVPNEKTVLIELPYEMILPPISEGIQLHCVEYINPSLNRAFDVYTFKSDEDRIFLATEENLRKSLLYLGYKEHSLDEVVKKINSGLVDNLYK